MYNILQYHTVFLSAKTKATLMDFLPRTLNVKHSFYPKKKKFFSKNKNLCFTLKKYFSSLLSSFFFKGNEVNFKWA